MEKTYRAIVTSAFILLLASLAAYPAPKAWAGVDLESLQTKVGGDLQYSQNERTGKLTLIKVAEGGLPLSPEDQKPLNKIFSLLKSKADQTATRTIRDYGAYFGLKAPAQETKIGKKTTDRQGQQHIRFDQTYQGIPVLGGQLIVHLENNDTPTAINGRVVPEVYLDTQPQISSMEAEKIALAIWEKQGGSAYPTTVKNELSILNKSLTVKQLEDKNYLAWQVRLRKENAIKDETYFIDAHSGELVYQLTNVKTVIDREIWDGSLIPLFDFWYMGLVWGPHTYGRAEGDPITGANPIYGNDGVDDLYTAVGHCHDYVDETFGIDGANDSGGIGDGATEDLDITRVKAYLDGLYLSYPWAGSCPNAYSNDYEIGFCWGMEVLDVVAHEYGHSVLNFAVPDILYESESGAFHEAYADITGEAVEFYANGSNDWLNGGDISLVPSTPRSLVTPGDYDDGLGNNPSYYYDSDFYCGSGDDYGVHHNSTVVSHAAYLMAMGGTENGCTVRTLGRARQEQVFYQTIENYITTAVDFNQVYDALLLACANLLYADAYCTEVKRAAEAVEIDQSLGPCNDGTEATPDCAADQFPDVASGSTFYDYIQDLAYGDVVSGYGDGTFRPGTNVNRGQMAKFIVNGFGFTTDTSCNPFPDVAEGSTFYDYIMTLKCNDVISGYGDGTFRPDVDVTRGQAMKFVVNGARTATDNDDFLPINEELDDFPDVPPEHTFYSHIMAAYSNDIVSGYGNGNFGPSDTTTRGQMSKMVDNTRIAIYWPD